MQILAHLCNMRLQTITEGMKVIAESHKSSLTFFTGLESDIDSANNNHYPIIFFSPPRFIESGSIESLGSNTVWELHLESQELLSAGSTTQQKQEALDRTREYLRDVFLKFALSGYDVTPVTFNNLTENLDFNLLDPSPFAPFIDINDNVTGWQVDFKIQESNSNPVCHINDIFN